MPAELTELTIREAGTLLAQRAVSATELVEATLQRIAATEPLVHAYARVMAGEARAVARQIDRDLAAGRARGALQGIPIGVKDLCNTRGVPTESGSRALAGFVPEQDATVVERLRAAGAIVIGKTVTHELAWGVNVPPTRNAWRLDCYPGGSSAGSGAAVAARSAFGAIGTDTGGSIREPAALNGVVGLKPTYGLIGRAGILPLSPSLDHAGPLARTVEDCALLLEAIAGYDPRDPAAIAIPATAYSADLDAGAAGLTIGVERGFFLGRRTRDEVRSAVDGVVRELAGAGARAVEIEFPDLDLMPTVATTIILCESASCHGRLLRERGADLDPATRRLLELGEMVPATHYLTAQRARAVLRDQLRALFVTHGLDALISPTVPTTTMPLDLVLQGDDSSQDPMTAAYDYMVPANITGQPALTVPCGFSAAGLPIGFQLLGRPFGEQTLFRLARAYERNHTWATMPPPLDGPDPSPAPPLTTT